MVAEILRWKRIRACVFSVDAVPSPVRPHGRKVKLRETRNNSNVETTYDNV